MIADSPSTNGGNGRGSNGQFTRGNSCGRGNPFAKQVAKLRTALMDAVSPEDLTAIVTKLVELAKTGDLQAAKLLLDRVLGKTVTIDIPAAAELDEQPVSFSDLGPITPENLEQRKQQMIERIKRARAARAQGN